MELPEILANPGVHLALLLVGVLGLSYITNYTLPRIFTGMTYRYLIAPGVIIHEYSHALGCVLVGARIREIRVFDERGGRVVHEEPRLALGQGIISVAPVFGAAIAVYLLALLLVPGFIGLNEIQISSWQFFVFAYLAAAITAAMAPSKQDLKVGLASFLGIALIIGLVAVSPTASDWFSFLLGDTYDRVVGIMQFSLIVLAVVALASGIVFLALHRTVRKGARYRSFD
ncbi:hypothetical protein EXS54_00280 [Patescibacteria group bacterium]|nr:hypothetical protein [Patescibacteria group bacterium]